MPVLNADQWKLQTLYSSGPGEASKLKFLLGEVLKGGLLQEHGLGPRAKVTEI